MAPNTTLKCPTEQPWWAQTSPLSQTTDAFLVGTSSSSPCGRRGLAISQRELRSPEFFRELRSPNDYERLALTRTLRRLSRPSALGNTSPLRTSVHLHSWYQSKNLSVRRRRINRNFDRTCGRNFAGNSGRWEAGSDSWEAKLTRTP